MADLDNITSNISILLRSAWSLDFYSNPKQFLKQFFPKIFLYLNEKILNRKMDFNFKIEKDGESFHAYAPDLPGCHTHGKTTEEALNNLKDAVNLYLSVLIEEQLSEQIAELSFVS